MDCSDRVRTDLHIHSTASDGTCTPAGILQRAERLGLGAIAITDHDTLDGSREALLAGIPSSIHFFTGIEISAAFPPFFPRKGSLHILGYGIRLDDPALNAALDVLQKARKDRNPAMIARLNELGIEMSMAELASDAGAAQIGRPHIARLMIRKGYVKTFDEAFDRYIGAGKPAYVDKYRIRCDDAIQRIAGAGGIAVLAHPGLMGLTHAPEFEGLITGLIAMGLGGIEVYYPEHSAEQTALYQRTAACFGLIATGGTDFHGGIKPGIEMGIGDGGFSVPASVYETLAYALRKRRPASSMTR